MKKKNYPRKPLSLKLMQLAFSRLGPVFPGYFSKLAYELWFTTHRFKRPKYEDVAAADAEQIIITINNVDVTVWSWGNGKPVLFMHGWSGRGTQAAHFLEPLLENGYRVVSYDGPAHGETGGKQTNMLEIAEVVMTLGEQFGPFHSTITHSFGGMILAYAINKGFHTGSAVCICPPATMDTIIENFKETLQLPDNVLSAMVTRLYRHYGSDFDQRVSMLNNVRSISIPALIIHDDRDRDIPWEDGKAVADTWTGAEFKLTHGLGHRRILRDPSTVATVTEFIINR